MEMEAEILEDMASRRIEDYDGTDEEAEEILLACIKRAMRTFKRKRRYPSSYTEKMIESDMEDWRDLITDSAIFWAVKQGMEFANSFTEAGASRSWQSESDIYSFHDFIPFSIIL